MVYSKLDEVHRRASKIPHMLYSCLKVLKNICRKVSSKYVVFVIIVLFIVVFDEDDDIAVCTAPSAAVA